MANGRLYWRLAFQPVNFSESPLPDRPNLEPPSIWRNLALRHQLGVLRRSVRRPELTSADRLLWEWLCGAWSDWRSALVIVKPETVIGWHRKGFRLYWTWKVRHGRPGRPPISKEVRKVIRARSRENPLLAHPASKANCSNSASI